MTSRFCLLAVLGLLLAACGSASTAWTPLPAGAEPPAACARADAEGVVAISANQLVATAEKALTIRFTNNESQPHDVVIYDGPDKKTKYLEGEVFSGPSLTKDYVVSALPAGEYYFDCMIHPVMRGALYVR
jgi:plastocyanin